MTKLENLEQLVPLSSGPIRPRNDATARLLPVIKALEDDFYRSSARAAADNLAEMAMLVSADFNQRHPDLPHEIATAFAWCYTFDFK